MIPPQTAPPTSASPVKAAVFASTALARRNCWRLDGPAAGDYTTTLRREVALTGCSLRCYVCWATTTNGEASFLMRGKKKKLCCWATAYANDSLIALCADFIWWNGICAAVGNRTPFSLRCCAIAFGRWAGLTPWAASADYCACGLTNSAVEPWTAYHPRQSLAAGLLLTAPSATVRGFRAVPTLRACLFYKFIFRSSQFSASEQPNGKTVLK